MVESSFPGELWEPVHAALAESGDYGRIQRVKPLRGGYSSHVLRLETAQQVYVLKWHPQAAAEFFTQEAQGLRLLQACGARVPHVYAMHAGSPSELGWILLEWIVGPTERQVFRQRTGAELGVMIAQVHLQSRGASAWYGIDGTSFFGSTRFEPAWNQDWVAYFRDTRFWPQVQRFGELFDHATQRKLIRLADRLDDLLAGVAREPVLLHGDLWGGNVLANAAGAPVLIDPAVIYGDREAEIAYSQLSGTIPSSFYRAYNEEWPLQPDFAERAPLYQIPPLLHIYRLGIAPKYAQRLQKILEHYAS